MIKNSSSVAEVLLKELHSIGVEYIFLVPGAQIVPIVFQLFEENPDTIPKPIIANHELAAGFMALGYARASGNMGVAISIGGPGAAYMAGAAVTAKTDDVPVLFITGNIPPENYGVGEFQDASPNGTNDCSVFREALGTSMPCDKPEDLEKIVLKIRECNKELKPLHVQIPISIQKSSFPSQISEQLNNFKKPVFDVSIDQQKVRTVLLIGQKALKSIKPHELNEFVKINSLPVVTDMKTRGLLSEDELESIGYIGFNSDVRALETFNCESELMASQVFTIGVNEDLIDQYIDKKQIDIITIETELFYNWMQTIKVDQNIINQRKLWLSELNKLMPPQPGSKKYVNKVSYSELIFALEETMPKETVYCLDSGQIRRAGSIFLKSYFPRTLLQSETLSPMGLGICSSIGAQLASPEKKVVCLFGDGSMRMNGIELSVAVRYNLPIVFVLCDNKAYASIKAPDHVKELPDIDWEEYGSSIGIETFYADNKSDFSMKLKKAIALEKPVLIWTMVPGLLDDELKKTEKVEYKNWLSTI